MHHLEIRHRRNVEMAEQIINTLTTSPSEEEDGGANTDGLNRILRLALGGRLTCDGGDGDKCTQILDDKAKQNADQDFRRLAMELPELHRQELKREYGQQSTQVHGEHPMTTNWPKPFAQTFGLWTETSAVCVACAAGTEEFSADMFIQQRVQGPRAVQQRKLQAETHQQSELHLHTLDRLGITQAQENEREAGKFMCAGVTAGNKHTATCYACGVTVPLSSAWAHAKSQRHRRCAELAITMNEEFRERDPPATQCERDDVKRVASVLERHLNTPNQVTRSAFKRALLVFNDDSTKTGTSTAAGNRD